MCVRGVSLLLDVFLSLVKDEEPSLLTLGRFLTCTGILQELAVLKLNDFGGGEVMVAILHLGSALNVLVCI